MILQVSAGARYTDAVACAKMIDGVSSSPSIQKSLTYDVQSLFFRQHVIDTSFRSFIRFFDCRSHMPRTHVFVQSNSQFRRGRWFSLVHFRIGNNKSHDVLQPCKSLKGGIENESFRNDVFIQIRDI